MHSFHAASISNEEGIERKLQALYEYLKGVIEKTRRNLDKLSETKTNIFWRKKEFEQALNEMIRLLQDNTLQEPLLRELEDSTTMLESFEGALRFINSYSREIFSSPESKELLSMPETVDPTEI